MRRTMVCNAMSAGLSARAEELRNGTDNGAMGRGTSSVATVNSDVDDGADVVTRGSGCSRVFPSSKGMSMQGPQCIVAESPISVWEPTADDDQDEVPQRPLRTGSSVIWPSAPKQSTMSMAATGATRTQHRSTTVMSKRHNCIDTLPSYGKPDDILGE